MAAYYAAKTARQARNAIQGAQNRAAGEFFEGMIKAACQRYREMEAADIDKTPEPTKQLTKMDERGQFRACYEKKAQPDFKGTLAGGRSIVFEAKFTSTGKMKQDVVMKQQADSLDRHEKLGAVCFVIVGFGVNDVRRIPWELWKRMKEELGRKYITPEDWRKYTVKQKRGIWDFLYRY